MDFSPIDMEDSLGCVFDFLKIKDSKSERVLCGHRAKLAILSAANFLEISFVSDDQLNYKGFQANYTFVSDHRKGCKI